MTDPRLLHASCEWQQRGPCVYCADHDERLFVGSADASPESRAAIQEMFDAAYKRLSEDAAPVHIDPTPSEPQQSDPRKFDGCPPGSPYGTWPESTG